jgi:tetratricopeptide (TPR) repeat protein
MLSFDEIAAEISRNLDFLAAKMRDIPVRQQSMRVVFEASWRQLSPAEQEMFMKLSVFYGGFTRDAAQAVTGKGLHQLKQLVNKSFVTAVPNQRFELHELLRQFAAGQLAATPEKLASANDAHCAYFAGFINEQSERLMGGRQRHALAAITADYDNIRAAWDWAVEHGKLPDMQRILRPLQLTFQFQSRYIEGVSLWENGRRKIEKLPPSSERDEVLIEMMVYWGWLLIRLGRLDQAEALLQECLSLYSQEAASAVAGYGTDPLTPLSLIATIRGDFETAVAYGRRSVAANQAESRIRNLYNAYYVLTSATVSQGDFAAAQNYARQAYKLIEQVDDRWYMAYILIELGKIALALGEIDEALEHFSTSYQLRQIFEDPEGQAIALTHLGQVMIQKKNFAEGKAYYQESFSLYQEINDKGGLARTYHGLGQIATCQGEFQNARYYLREAFTTAVEMNFIPLIIPILVSIGKLFAELDMSARALALFLFIEQHPSSDQTSREEAAVHARRLSADNQPEELAWPPNQLPTSEQVLTKLFLN